MLLVSFIGYSSVKNEIIQNNFVKLDTIAQVQKNHLQDSIQNELDLLRLFTGKPVLRTNLRDFNNTPTSQLQTSINNNLLQTKTSVANIVNIFVANPTGTIVGSTDQSILGTNVSTEDFFTKGIRENDVSILKKDNATGVLFHYLAGPLVLDGNIVGMTTIVVDAKDIISLAQDFTGLGNTGETLLVKNDGNGNALFLTPTRDDPSAALNLIVQRQNKNLPSVSAAAGVEEIFDNAVDYQNVPVFAATRYIKDVNWGIVVKIDQDEVLTPIKKLRGLFLYLIGMAGFFIVLIGILISRSITEPILRLITATIKVARGDLSQHINITSQDEIEILGRAFNTMTSKLKKSHSMLELQVRDRTNELKNTNIAVLNVLEDLSVEKSKYEVLANDLVKFKLALDSASDQIIITDAEGIVLYGNKSIEKNTGYKVEDAVGKKSGTLWKKPMPLEYYQNLWNTIKTQKKMFIGEIENRKKTGELYTAAISIAPVVDSAGNVEFFVGIERDITKEKEIDRAKSEFVSIASHQLRTPLGIMKWYLEALENEDYYKKSPLVIRDYVDEIYKSNERVLSLVRDLLSVSRIGQGRVKNSPTPADVIQAMQEVGKQMDIVAQEKNVTLNIQIQSQKIPLVNIDILRFHEVLENLIGNAIEYSFTGSSIDVTIRGEGDSLFISVKDSGIGISPSDQKKLFTKFFRSEKAVVHNPKGSGLGLYLVKSYVEGWGGRVAVESTEGKGSTFTISLPISQIKNL